jgi:YVTN family beta-propeller protein
MVKKILFLSALAAAAMCPAQNSLHYVIVNKFPLTGEGGWDYMNVDPGSHHLFISRGTHVQVMDTESGKVVGDIPNTPGVHGIALATRLGKGFTSNGREGTVTVFNLRTLAEIARVQTTGQNPDCIAYDPSAQRVFTFNGRSGNSTVIDARTNKVIGAITLDGRPEFAAADGHGHIFCNIEDKSELEKIDTHTLKPEKIWSIPPGEGPSGLAIDPRRELLFSVCDKIMVISDGVDGKVIAHVEIGDGPDAAGFDPRLHLAFSSNGEGTLTVVREENNGEFKVVQNLETQPSARTMALDPTTHRIYLIAAQVQPGQPGERRRRTVPGSTVILVAAPTH